MTNREFEIKTIEIEREILEFKMKMKELTKAGGVAQGRKVRAKGFATKRRIGLVVVTERMEEETRVIPGPEAGCGS